MYKRYLPAVVLAVCMWASVTARNCDVVFCIDTSDSMTAMRTAAANESVREWHDALKSDPNVDIKFGVILYAHNAITLMDLRSRSQAQVVAELSKYADTARSGSTDTAACLQRANTQQDFFQHDGSRTQFMVLITDGTSNNKIQTDAQVRNLQRNGVTVIAIALEPRQNYDSFFGITELKNDRAGAKLSDFFFEVDPLDRQRIVNRFPIRTAICPPDACDRKRCSHTCHISGGFAECSCPSGSTLGSDGRTCQNTPGPIPSTNCNQKQCSHTCAVSGGVAVCTCPAGYVLASNERDCQRPCNNIGCQHFCRVERGVPVCKCYRGFSLAANYKSCRKGHGPFKSLLMPRGYGDSGEYSGEWSSAAVRGGGAAKNMTYWGTAGGDSSDGDDGIWDSSWYNRNRSRSNRTDSSSSDDSSGGGGGSSGGGSSRGSSSGGRWISSWMGRNISQGRIFDDSSSGGMSSSGMMWIRRPQKQRIAPRIHPRLNLTSIGWPDSDSSSYNGGSSS